MDLEPVFRVRSSSPGRACFGLACLLGLGACTPIKVKLGMKVYLAKTPVASITVNLPNGPGLAPGESCPWWWS